MLIINFTGNEKILTVTGFLEFSGVEYFKITLNCIVLQFFQDIFFRLSQVPIFHWKILSFCYKILFSVISSSYNRIKPLTWVYIFFTWLCSSIWFDSWYKNIPFDFLNTKLVKKQVLTCIILILFIYNIIYKFYVLCKCLLQANFVYSKFSYYEMNKFTSLCYICYKRDIVLFINFSLCIIYFILFIIYRIFWL